MGESPGAFRGCSGWLGGLRVRVRGLGGATGDRLGWAAASRRRSARPGPARAAPDQEGTSCDSVRVLETVCSTSWDGLGTADSAPRMAEVAAVGEAPTYRTQNLVRHSQPSRGAECGLGLSWYADASLRFCRAERDSSSCRVPAGGSAPSALTGLDRTDEPGRRRRGEHSSPGLIESFEAGSQCAGGNFRKGWRREATLYCLRGGRESAPGSTSESRQRLPRAAIESLILNARLLAGRRSLYQYCSIGRCLSANGPLHYTRHLSMSCIREQLADHLQFLRSSPTHRPPSLISSSISRPSSVFSTTSTSSFTSLPPSLVPLPTLDHSLLPSAIPFPTSPTPMIAFPTSHDPTPKDAMLINPRHALMRSRRVSLPANLVQTNYHSIVGGGAVGAGVAAQNRMSIASVSSFESLTEEGDDLTVQNDEPKAGGSPRPSLRPRLSRRSASPAPTARLSLPPSSRDRKSVV